MPGGPIITLLTDFGLQDNFVGVMKGVILGINPKAVIVDLVHDLTPHDVNRAAFALNSAVDYFPPQTIFTAVVDPGVGSSRAAIAVRALDRYFIAPDNGLLSFVLERAGDCQARLVENPDFMLPPISRTFNGRDVFAPAAARLSLGAPFEEIGPPAPDLVRLEPMAARREATGVRGRVLYVDRFGNLITNIAPADLAGKDKAVVEAGGVVIDRISDSYSAAGPGEYLVLWGSSGYLEIARNMDRAEAPPRLTAGTAVMVRSES